MTNELPLSAEERLAALEKKVNALFANGLDLFAQEGYLQIGSNSNNGAVRLNNKALQVATRGIADGGLWFVQSLVPEPDEEAMQAYVNGLISDSQASIFLTANAEADPTAQFEARVLPNGTGTAELFTQHSGGSVSAYANLELAQSRTWGQFQLGNTVLLFLALTADPGTLVDGMFWYNHTDDQFKFYEGGTIKTLGGGMSTKVKEADETVTTNTTLQNDDELLFAVAANEVWQFEGVLFLTAPAAADFKMTFTGPTGAVGAFTGYYDTTSDAGDRAQGGTLGTSVSFALTVDGVSLRFFGGIHNGANAGNLQLQWAQDTSSGSTLVLAGSYIKYQLANT